MKYFKQLLLLPKAFRLVFVLLLVVVWVAISNFHQRNVTFNGIIEKIRYEEPKHILFITVNRKEYDIEHYQWHPNYSLAVGDSAVKKKGEEGFLLIKSHQK
ncbi:hypothetical protein ACFQZI_10815 [Mucilaginibacter lutimaris]|uniref:Uncharacterized protein n=1 Tax=Mucilaginibacter lutimaris TaxID=931629 RepID=A0ABW2ZGK0_9SPHI